MKQTLIILIIIICSCNQATRIEIKISKEIESLNTIEKQKNFLEAIGNLDQKLRHSLAEVMNKFGYESKEYQNAIRLMMQTDNKNLLKIESYLRKYGHPTQEKHGKDACGTPWLVVHHATEGIEPRKRNFKYIYEAYKNGDIDVGAISFYLNRMYDIKFGKRIDWNRAFRIEEELDTLYNALDLWSIINETVEKM